MKKTTKKVAKKAEAKSPKAEAKTKKAAAPKAVAPKAVAKTAAKKVVKKAVKPAAKAPKPQAKLQGADPALLKRILTSLEDDKAEEITAIELAGRSSLCDAIVVASGRSSRHVASIAEHLARRLKEAGYGTRPLSGTAQGDWALVDAGDVIVHIFRPEVRAYYDLEGMWSVDEPKRGKK